MNTIRHQLYDFLRLVGMRDRLRCPRCRKVGTWKPHGAWPKDWDDRPVRRWLCKWCGHYVGPEGEKQARVHPSRGWWLLDDDEAWKTGTTPERMMADAWPNDNPPNPWRG